MISSVRFGKFKYSMNINRFQAILHSHHSENWKIPEAAVSNEHNINGACADCNGRDIANGLSLGPNNCDVTMCDPSLGHSMEMHTLSAFHHSRGSYYPL